MKNIRIILGLLIVAFSGICSYLSAQQTLRVYKHDGTMEVFFYSNLDSITFSNVDDSGITQDFVVTQNFHTADSIYKFPVSEIDSVAFSTIPTVYKSNAVRIDGQLRDYVIGADSLTLYLKKSIPDALLPKVGDNIATLECDEVLPYGFFGKVEKITHEATSINVECTQASLIDIFDSLGLEGSATSESPSVHSRSPFDTWPPKHYNLTIPSLKAEVKFGQEVETGVGLSGSYEMSSSAKLSTEKCDVYWALLITPMPFQLPQIYCSFTSIAQNTLSIEASLSAGVKWEKKFPIEAIRNIRIPGVAAVFEFFEEVGVFIEIEGKMGLNGSLSRPVTTVLHLSYDDKEKSSIPPTFKMTGRDGAKSEITLEGEAAISVGLYGKTGVAPLIKEMAKIEAELKAGATFSSTLSLTPVPTPIEILNTEMYDEMDCDDFFRGDFTLTGEITAKALNHQKQSEELELGDLFVKNPFFTRGIVPHFDEVSLTESNRSGVLSAKATLSRQLMFNTPVGFALYDVNKKLVDKWWSPTEYKDNEGLTLSHNFEGLSPNKEYTLHPITRAFNDNMVANPSSTGKFTLDVETGEATDITSNSAVLDGKVLGMKEGAYIKVGFAYRVGNRDSWKTIEALLSEDDRFSVVLNGLKDETAYQYRAFIEMNEEKIYGDIYSFTTLAPVITPDTPTVKTDEATNISSNSAVLNGSVFGMKGGDSAKVGFEYRTNDGDAWKAVIALSISDDGRFNIFLNGLSKETVYQYRAFIEIDEGKEYGDILSFTTLKQDIQIDTQGISFIKAQKIETYFDDGEFLNLLSITINITGSDSIEYLKPILYVNGGETYYPFTVPFNGDGEITFEMETYDTDEDFVPHSMGIDAFMKDGKVYPSSNMIQFSGSASSLIINIVDNPNKNKN